MGLSKIKLSVTRLLNAGRWDELDAYLAEVREQVLAAVRGSRAAANRDLIEDDVHEVLLSVLERQRRKMQSLDLEEDLARDAVKDIPRASGPELFRNRRGLIPYLVKALSFRKRTRSRRCARERGAEGLSSATAAGPDPSERHMLGELEAHAIAKIEALATVRATREGFSGGDARAIAILSHLIPLSYKRIAAMTAAARCEAARFALDARPVDHLLPIAGEGRTTNSHPVRDFLVRFRTELADELDIPGEAVCHLLEYSLARRVVERPRAMSVT
jgi:hypothetical protein